MENLNTNDKTMKLFFLLATIILILVIAYFFFVKFLIIIFPFIFAGLIAWSIDPVVNFLQKKGLPRGLGSLIILLALLLIISFLAVFVINNIVIEITKLANDAPKYINILNHYARQILGRLQIYYFSLPPKIIEIIENNISNLLSYIASFLKTASSFTVGLVSLLPGFFIAVVISFVAAYFLSRDKDKIFDYFTKQLPEPVLKKTMNIKTDLFKTFFGFLRAEAIIMSIIFLMVSIGLAIIGYKYAFLIGLFISIVDILPVLGTGSVLVPWALINFFIIHNIRNGVLLLILYVIILVGRQMMEPHIVGTSIGLHPVVTLMSMYIGLKLMGFGGIVLGPVVVILFKTLYKSGLIPPISKLWGE